MFGCTNVRPAGQNGVQPLPPKMCDAARVALCTSNSARAENKPKYVWTVEDRGLQSKHYVLNCTNSHGD